LIAANVNALKYGAMLTPKEFYSVWKEKDAPKSYITDVLNSVNAPAAEDVLKQVSADLQRDKYVQPVKEVPTEQDKGVYSLLKPERMLDIARNFIIYDNGVKKITRYQQFFAIKKTLSQVKNFDASGRRKGGLIWHTQGSGKSLTMVMLVKNLIENIQNPRVIVVTDRIDLDIQIRDTFKTCNIKTGVQQAVSGKDLINRIKSKTLDVITTLVHKFEKESSFKDEDNNIFVLIDEAHRTQGGDANAMMNRVLPNSCQIAFTGTPLMKKEKSAVKFGGMIDAYTISEAEADGAILPLIYQGRFAEQSVNAAMDLFYERISAGMNGKQKKVFEKKCVSKAILEETSHRVEMIALDVYDHYKKYFQNTGLKAQLVAPSKTSAVLFKKTLDLLNGIKSEVVISDSAYEEIDDDQLPEHKKLVADFLSEEKRKHGSLESREKKIIKEFKNDPEGCEMLIVVDKLLTGFDAPRNAALYLAKQLQDHNLLQAIARVNRIFDGDPKKQTKTNGLIVDYSKNAKNLKDALALFSSYDKEDIERVLLNTDDQIKLLENLYQKLHDAFKDIKNKNNTDAYIETLKDNEEKRTDFYENVNDFIKVFSTCFSLYDFHQKFDIEKLKRYRKDLKRFVEIKKTTQLALAEKVDFSKYRDQLRKLLDKYVAANEVEILSREINLSDMREFNRYIEDEKNGMSDRSKAAAIAAQTSKVISERYKQDEVFYKKFSDRIGALLKELEQAKREDIAFLFQEMKNIQNKVEDYEDNDIPDILRDKKTTHPFYRNLKILAPKIESNVFADIVARIVEIIQKNKIVDWHMNPSVKKAVLIGIEDFLLDEIDAGLTAEEAENIAQESWRIAVENRKGI
jgi:type I restriction enzyme R subunit